MATGFDDLIERLLFDVALAGRPGFGAEGIETIVKNYHEHHQPSAPPVTSTESLANPTDTGPTPNNQDSVGLLNAVWQRLEHHPDITVKRKGQPVQQAPSHGEAQGSTTLSNTAVHSSVHASEERIWQAIAGHGVDQKRVPRKHFELLEVIAAHGPEGVLQTEATRLTGHDKTSVPARTNKLAERGYITKEKLADQKGATSRLILWRFATQQHTAIPNDTVGNDSSMGEDVNRHNDENGVEEIQDAGEESTPSSSDLVHSAIATRSPEPDNVQDKQGPAAATNTQSQQTHASPKIAQISLSSPQPIQVAQEKESEMIPKGRYRPQPIHRTVIENDPEILDEPGVYFPAQRRENQGRGRPRKSLVAVIKSAKMQDVPGLKEDKAREATSKPSALKITGWSPSNGKPVDPVQGVTASEKPSEPLVAYDAPAPATPTTTPKRPVSQYGAHSTHETLLQDNTEGLTKAQIGQRRRWERVRAQTAAAAEAKDDGIAKSKPVITKLPLGRSLLDRVTKRPGGGRLSVLSSQAGNKAASPTSSKDRSYRASFSRLLSHQKAQAGRHLFTNGIVRFAKMFGHDATPLPESTEIETPVDDSAHIHTHQHHDLDDERDTRIDLDFSVTSVPSALDFPPFEQTDDPAEKLSQNQMRPLRGMTREERRNVVVDIVAAAGGIFPGLARELWYPYATKCMEKYPGQPDIRTVSKAMESLLEDGRLKKLDFEWTGPGGDMKTFHLLLAPHVDSSSAPVKAVQQRMIDALPGDYIPAEVVISDRLHAQGRLIAPNSVAKRRRQEESAVPEATKRWRLSPAADEHELDYVNDDDMYRHQTASTVAQSLMRLEVPAEPPKKRGGWPKGRPRGPRIPKPKQHDLVGNDVMPLLSLLFQPIQVAHQPSGTIGSPSITLSQEMAPQTVRKGKARDAVATPMPASRKRSASAMSGNEHSTAALLMRPGQTLLETSWTLGTNGTVPATPPTDEVGRGKRIRRSTEKAAAFSKFKLSGVDTPLKSYDPTKKAAPYSSSRFFDDPDGLVSTEYVNNHPHETFYHRGKGRWVRGLPPPGASYKTAVKGPGAAEYLAKIGTAEGKPKKHGEVVDGQQMKKNGEPWRRQPITVNGVRVRPHDEHPTLQPPVSGSRPASMRQHLETVQYESPSTATPYYTLDGYASPAPVYQQPPPQNGVFMPYPSMNGAVQASTPSLYTHSVFQGSFHQDQSAGAPTPTPTPEQLMNKRKRPYTYKSRKQLSTIGPDGWPVELDRDSDEDYTQSSASKRQRRTSQVKHSPVKTKYSIDRQKVSAAVALVRNLCPATGHGSVRWDLVGLALGMHDNGAAADRDFRSMSHYAPNAKYIDALQQEIQEPFLAALEKGELPNVDLEDPTRSDWRGLLQWVEKKVAPMVTEESMMNAKKSVDLHEKKKGSWTRKVQQPKQNRPIVDSTALFPATYTLESQNGASDLDSKEDLIMAKSWLRANSATKDGMYDMAKASEKLTALGTPLLQAVQELQQSNTIRQLKKGRQRPGRNFEITQYVWEQFKRWSGETSGVDYLQNLAATRARFVKYFTENDTLEMGTGPLEHESLVLNALLAQGMLQMEVKLPSRNDDIDAPFPKLNKWSYGGPRHDTRKVERSIFDLAVVYTKTAAFSVSHNLRLDVPIPSLPQPVAGEALARVPFWIDVHGNLIPDLWELALSSIIQCLVTKPGVTAKGIEKAHKNKLWAWEIELALEWMREVGITEEFGRGGWTVGEEWVCAFGDEVVGGWR